MTEHWDDEAVAAACQQIALDAGHESLSAWSSDDDAQKQADLVRGEVIRLMDHDVKATGLKSLQGLIWRSGFESGEMVAHVYDDVAPALLQWKQANLDIRIYSSGSIGAQKLFFGHTEKGDLLNFFTEHYDTTIGSKREPISYERIAKGFGLPADEILFISDVVAELDAAKSAGLQTVLSVRPGNAPVSYTHLTLPTICSV